MTVQDIDAKTVKVCRDLIMAEAWVRTRPGNGTRPYSDGLYAAAQMLGDLLVELDRNETHSGRAAATSGGTEKNG